MFGALLAFHIVWSWRRQLQTAARSIRCYRVECVVTGAYVCSTSWLVISSVCGYTAYVQSWRRHPWSIHWSFGHLFTQISQKPLHAARWILILSYLTTITVDHLCFFFLFPIFFLQFIFVNMKLYGDQISILLWTLHPASTRNFKINRVVMGE